MSRATPPSHGTVLVPALMTRLIGIVSTVIVEIAFPQRRDTFAVVTRELLISAGSVVTNFLKLIRAISAVFVTITLPGPKNTLATILALEHMLRAIVITLRLVAVVPAIVEAVADSSGQDADIVLALELTLLTYPLRARLGLI